MTVDPRKEPIAIIGIGCRLPGDVYCAEDLWNLLINKTDAISEIPEDRWNKDFYYDNENRSAGKINVRHGGFIKNIDRFDAAFFGISPVEALRIDPQHRLLLETAYNAIDNAGIPVENLSGSDTGVFVGISSHDYGDIQNSPSERQFIGSHSSAGGAQSIAANRISYTFDLKGPSLIVDTACSSSLVAVHLACMGLRNSECSIALVGGVNAIIKPEPEMCFSRGGFLAPDGRCKTFDNSANGYIRSEGCGMVVLKPLSRALKDGNHIYATIIGSAVNQDGKTNGISMPNPSAQMTVMYAAYRDAEIDPSMVDYVEAHGTGTAAGDPIEAQSIGTVIGKSPNRKGVCYLGSVKTNIGHLEPASGIAGLIKLSLAMSHDVIPPNIHFRTPNPKIDFDDLRLKVPTESINWPVYTKGKYAGINSFGFGGTNAHLVLKGKPAKTNTEKKKHLGEAHLFTASATTEQSLKNYCNAVVATIDTEAYAIEDVCGSAANNKSQYAYRAAVYAQTADELKKKLASFVDGQTGPGLNSGRTTIEGVINTVFVFSGQGPQWWAMGRTLYHKIPIFKTTVEQIDLLFMEVAGWSILKEFLKDEKNTRINETVVAQPAIFALQVALYEYWKTLGVEPSAVVGHSVGEVAAAYVSGSLSIKDAVKVIYHRSRIQDKATGKGIMAALGVSRQKAEEYITPYNGLVSIAAINGPAMVTVSGNTEPIEEICLRCEKDGVFNRVLVVNVPFHSHHMEPLQNELIESLQNISARKCSLRLYSTVTGGELKETVQDGSYWFKNVRQPVQFTDTIETLIDDGYNQFVEISPHPILSAGIADLLEKRKCAGIVVPSITRKKNEIESMYTSLGKIYVNGGRINFRKLYGDYLFVKLPPYPFQREKFWLETNESRKTRVGLFDHPHLKDCRRSIKDANMVIWDVTLDPKVDLYLQEHKVQGPIVFPGAGHVELGISAALVSFGDNFEFLEDIHFKNALFLPDKGEAPKIQLEILNNNGNYYLNLQKSDGSWMMCSHGRINHVGGVFSSTAIDIGEIRKRVKTSVNIGELHESLARSGLHLGPSFRAISELYNGDREAFGIVETPESLQGCAGNFNLHPAILDSCFQTLFGAFFNTRDQITTMGVYIPVHIDRVKFYKKAGTGPLMVYSKLNKRDESFAMGDIWIYDADGNPVAEFQGLLTKYLKGSRGEKAGEDKDWYYEFTWKQRESEFKKRNRRSNEFMTNTSALAPVVHKVIEATRGNVLNGRFYNDFEPRFDDLCHRYIIKGLTDIGIEFALCKILHVNEEETKGGVIQRHQRLFHHIFRLLEQGGYCKKTGEGVFEVIKDVPFSKIDDVQKEMEEEFPEFRLELNLLGRCGPHIAGVLRGKVNPVELIFPQKRWEETVSYYVESYSFNRYNDMVAVALKKVVNDVPDNRSIRVLEIGAGTGGVTQAILPLFPPERTEYYYTDISEGFLMKARNRFNEFSFVKYELLDIETMGESPEIYRSSFDIVIASDVLHATRDVTKTLENVKSYMGSGALLVMLEVTRPPVYLDLIFGMTDGWWRYEDIGLRQDHATMDGARWKKTLEKTGFSGIYLMSDFPENDKSCQNVIMAHAPENDIAGNAGAKATPSQKCKWLVFEDRMGVAAKIAKKFDNKNDNVVSVKPGNAFKFDDGIVEMNLASDDDYKKLLNVVEDVDNILFALAIDTTDNRDVDGETLLSDADRSSLPLIRLMKALSEHIPTITQCSIWILTSGAQAINPDEVPRISQAGFRGVVRTIANELPRFRTTLIDLGEKTTDGELDMTIEEMANKDMELEVAFRDYRRYVNIIQRVTPEQSRRTLEKEVPVADAQFTLDLEEYGSLETVCLRKNRKRKCMEGEVEVQVKAAALNFRDIMVAMGLLTDEAVIGGLYDRSLGLECAGKITATGPGVKSLKPGDAVFGFARNSISGYTYARECHMLKTDGALSMPEYAGLPIVYLTAYYSIVHLCRLKKNEKILIHSAAGGVGIAAVQIALAIGAKVFATVGDDEKRKYLRSFGVENIYDSRSLDFCERIMNDTDGYGVDVVINALSGHAIFKGFSCLAPFGRFVEIGKKDIYNNSSLGMKCLGNNISFFVVDVDRMLGQKAGMAGKIFKEAMKFFKENHLVPHPLKIFSVGRIKEALRYMADGRHIGKVVLSLEGVAVISPEKKIRFEKDASYLISGGCSGFGLAVARWMSHKGAGALVLVSRSGIRNDEDRAIVEEMEKNGTMVYIEKCDVADTVKMKELGEKIKQNYPPLKGVHHCAMVLCDTPISLMDREKFMTTYIPKVVGGWNLHTMTKELDLDFFINYSSISSVFGNPGQANYAAANSFLDELTRLRNDMGLPCITINWGVLGGTGFVARTQSIRNHLAKQGWYAFSLDESLGILEKMLLLAPQQRVAINAEWAKIAELYPHVMETSRFGEIIRGSRKNTSGEKHATDGRVRDSLMNTSESERFDIILRHLKMAICSILGTASDKVDERESITRLGLDSLMANEIRSWISRELGIEYSLMQIMKGPNLLELTEQLLEIIAHETQSVGDSVAKNDFEKWIVRTKIITNPRKRIFCFPYFAGGASAYNTWQNYFGDEIEVCQVQLPGREERTGEAAIDDVIVLVKEIAGIIRPLIENVSFVFYGHSMGALIAFELENYIEKEYGLAAAHLIAGGWKAPQVENPFSVLEKVTIDEVYDKKNTHKIVEHMRFLGIPEVVLSNDTLIQEMLPALQADIVMGKRYRNSDTTKLQSSITVIAGENDTIFKEEHLKPWKEKTEKAFHFRTIKGGHLFVRDNRDLLLPMIREIIEN